VRRASVGLQSGLGVRRGGDLVDVMVEDGVMGLWTGKGDDGRVSEVPDGGLLFEAEMAVATETGMLGDDIGASSDISC
jgi:hypothetical protein